MYGLWVARGLLATGNKRVLLIGAEHLRVGRLERPVAAVIFGTARVRSCSMPPTARRLLGFDVGSDGSLIHLIACEHGGTITMDGKETFRRACASWSPPRSAP